MEHDHSWHPGVPDSAWFSRDVPPGQSLTVNPGEQSAPGDTHAYLPGVGAIKSLMPRPGPDTHADATMFGNRQEWGRVWIQLGKTLEVYGYQDWWLK
jgi:hypothetical protein